jgi:hypothetical protein
MALEGVYVLLTKIAADAFWVLVAQPRRVQPVFVGAPVEVGSVTDAPELPCVNEVVVPSVPPFALRVTVYVTTCAAATCVVEAENQSAEPVEDWYETNAAMYLS